MLWDNILTTVFTLVIIPVLGILTKYVVAWLAAKAEELKGQTENELYWKYIDMLQTTVTKCVLTTQQTYVDALKKEGKFDLEAQEKAFIQTFNAVKDLLAKEALDYLDIMIPDLDEYITKLIESQIYINKH